MSRYALGVDVTVRTKVLTLPELPNDPQERLHLIGDFYQQGLNSWEIADQLIAIKQFEFITKFHTPLSQKEGL